VKDKLKGILIAGVAIAALAVGGAAIAGATGGGDDGDGKPITGHDLARASAVALAQTGGGKVTGSEVGDEEGAYEVEVTKADGKQVDVHLDRSFHVIGSKPDREDTGGSQDDR
jgi:uncharacterized membrane protein YkoI